MSLLLLFKPQGDDRNVTCMAENPVGHASRTVFLKQVCAGSQVLGILGESVSFHLQSLSPSNKVFWLRNGILVASLRWEPPQCQLRLFGAYDGRDVTVSQDCRSLTVSGLREEDSAGYRAQVLDRNGEVVGSRTFNLQVY
ncbi:hypothetical protein lerEdw1_001773, partial [Lerista edwardsae]